MEININKFGIRRIVIKKEREFEMEESYGVELLSLGTALTELALKGTATAIAAKIRAIKNEKDIEKVRKVYDEIINEILSEREEAVRIAQAYKSELEKVSISDEDIEHLNHTVERLLELFGEFQVSTAEEEGKEQVANEIDKRIKSFEQIKELISVDTLKTMQLLGFNYKAAIGEPLTLMLRNYILTRVPEPDQLKNFERMITPQMVDILKDKNAYSNFNELINLRS